MSMYQCQRYSFQTAYSGKGYSIEPPINNHLKMWAISCYLTGGGELKGIEPAATSCSTGQHSTYWANPATFQYSGSSRNGHSRRWTGCSTYGHLHKTPFFSTPTKLCIFTFPEAASSSYGYLFRVPRVPLTRNSTVKQFSIISAIYMLICSPSIIKVLKNKNCPKFIKKQVANTDSFLPE